MSRVTQRTRALLSVTAIAGVAAAAVVGAVVSPAQSADPSGDCAVATPVADLHADDPVHGLTVTHGTEPEEFDGKVLGVLDNGIAPGVDMVMVRLTGAEVDDHGIWQGMSGSPVYAADDTLIGAVAYGLATGPSPVAGVTPFEDMDDLLGDLGGRVAVGPAAARQIARHSDVSVRQALKGFRALPLPVGVAGVGPAALARTEKQGAGHRWLPRSAYAAGHAAAAADASSVVAGGNLAATMSYGDVTMGGVGTATSVCGDRVVAFGHPLNFAGSTTLGLSPADAIYIQDDLFAGFKVANIADPVGTITDDGLAGIAGTLGDLPETTDLSVTLRHGADSRTGVTHVADRTADTMAFSTLYGIVGDHVAVLRAPAVGTELMSWTITGSDRDGHPFELASADRYSSSSDVSVPVGFAMGDLVFGLGRIPGIDLDTITTHSTLTDAARAYSLTKVEVRQGGAWVRLTRRTPLAARSGKALPVRVTVSGSTATKVLTGELQVPATFAGRTAVLTVAGGLQASTGRMPRDIDAVSDWLDGQVRNDQVLLQLTREGRNGGVGAGAPRGGKAPKSVTTELGPTDGVVRGHTFGVLLVS